MLMQAELVYHNREQLLKLPENIRLGKDSRIYCSQDPTTGAVSLLPCRPEWQAFLDAWDKLDGREWELPRYAYNIERDPFADWEE